MIVINIRHLDDSPFALVNSVAKESVDEKKLIMLCSDGLYFLVPYEVMENNKAVLDHNILGEQFNLMPRPTIRLSQCIPIPSETAKILLEL